MSLVPETWNVIARDDDAVVIAREKVDFTSRLTAWRLSFIKGQWRVTHIFFSKVNPGLDRIPARLKEYKTPIRLSDSAIDNRLRSMVNE